MSGTVGGWIGRVLLVGHDAQVRDRRPADRPEQARAVGGPDVAVGDDLAAAGVDAEAGQPAQRVGLDVALGVGGSAEEDREHLADDLLLQVGLLEPGDPLALELDQGLPDLVGVGVEPGRDLLIGAGGGDGDPGQAPHLHQVVLHAGDRAVAQLGQRGSLDGGVLVAAAISMPASWALLSISAPTILLTWPRAASASVALIGPALGGQRLGLLLERVSDGGGGGDLGLQVGDLVIEALVARQDAAAGGDCRAIAARATRLPAARWRASTPAGLRSPRSRPGRRAVGRPRPPPACSADSSVRVPGIPGGTVSVD